MFACLITYSTPSTFFLLFLFKKANPERLLRAESLGFLPLPALSAQLLLLTLSKALRFSFVSKARESWDTSIVLAESTWKWQEGTCEARWDFGKHPWLPHLCPAEQAALRCWLMLSINRQPGALSVRVSGAGGTFAWEALMCSRAT